jgi:NADPH2:quinone reductase
MTQTTPSAGLQIRSLVKSTGELELCLVSIATPTPGPNEVLIRVDAAPLNPSDLGLLFGAADMTTAVESGTLDQPIITAQVPKAAMQSMAGRLDQSMPVGNEGAGLVIGAGTSDAAQALLGKTVAVLGGAMYSQYRCVSALQCLPLPPGASAADGASSFVNPMTALAMVETMRAEGHTALVHTAAASNLGIMLNRICLKDGIPLVNIVRSRYQTETLRALGAGHICDSSSPSFLQDLTQALSATGATLAFDAIGGGPLAGQILTCMEAVLTAKSKEYSRYGSGVHKQVYIYGGLGMAWGVGGWLVFPYLQKLDPSVMRRVKQRVADELKTTFESHYAGEVSLVEALRLETLSLYGKRTTGQKYLINPHKA